MSGVFDFDRWVGEQMQKKSWERCKLGAECEGLPNQKVAIKYACPVCETLYDDPESAAACLATPYDDGGLKVGDIVIVPGKWAAYHDPKDPWVAFTIPADKNSTSHFDRVDNHVPYYVVTAIHADPHYRHRCLVTLVSLVGSGISYGRNPANGEGHYWMYKVGDKPQCPRNTCLEWYERFYKLLDTAIPCDRVKEEAKRLAALGIQSSHLL